MLRICLFFDFSRKIQSFKLFELISFHLSQVPIYQDFYFSEDNEFYVGREHYYDNRIDIQKENDEAELKEPEEEPKEDLKVAADTSDELVYDNDEYYYEEYENDDEYYLRRQRQERLKRLQERRRAWLRSQREKYYKSLTRWRRPLAQNQIHRPYRKRPSRPLKRPKKQQSKAEDNRRHYESQFNSHQDRQKSESTSFMRSLLGVDPFCVHDDAQFSCTFTPLCWMKGGVAMSGCDSMLYSCCVSHTIARRQVLLFLFYFSMPIDPLFVMGDELLEIRVSLLVLL